MKHNIIIILTVYFGFISCYRDKSTIKEIDIPEIHIDTTGISGPFFVFQNDVLKIEPTISKKGSVNLPDNDIAHEWLMTTTPMANGYLSNEKFIRIGKNKTLDTIIPFRPSKNPYMIWYKVKDLREDLEYSMFWKAYINTSYGEGLLVADTKDGLNTDLSLIVSRDVSGNYKENTPKVLYNIYSKANNDNRINGIATEFCFHYLKNKDKLLFIASKNAIEAIDLIDFSVIGKNLELSHDDQLIFDISQITKKGNHILIVNNGEIRCFDISWGEKIGIALSGDYHVDNQLSNVHEPYNVEPSIVFYDSKYGRFLHISGHMSDNILAKEFTYDPLINPYNPNELPNLKCIKAHVGASAVHYFIMKNTDSGIYEVYTIDKKGAKMYYKLPPSNISEAIGFVVCENQEVIFFATKHQIYAILLGGNSPKIELRHTIATGEEITHIDMFRQAWYLLNPYQWDSNTGNYKIPLSTHETLLLIGSYSKNKKGQLYMFPLEGVNTGLINTKNPKIIGGFEKIIGTVSQE